MAHSSSPLSRDLAGLSAVVVGMALLFAAPAWFLAETDGLMGLLIAAAVCFFPGVGIVWVANRVDCDGKPERLFQIVVAGMMGRMAIALVAFLIVKKTNPDWGFSVFGLWLVLMYLATLAFEAWLASRHLARHSQTVETPPATD